MINNYPGYGPPASPANSRGFGPANSPGPMDLTYNGDTSLGYLQAASPQPSFGAMNRVRQSGRVGRWARMCSSNLPIGHV